MASRRATFGGGKAASKVANGHGEPRLNGEHRDAPRPGPSAAGTRYLSGAALTARTNLRGLLCWGSRAEIKCADRRPGLLAASHHLAEKRRVGPLFPTFVVMSGPGQSPKECPWSESRPPLFLPQCEVPGGPRLALCPRERGRGRALSPMSGVTKSDVPQWSLRAAPAPPKELGPGCRRRGSRRELPR